MDKIAMKENVDWKKKNEGSNSGGRESNKKWLKNDQETGQELREDSGKLNNDGEISNAAEKGTHLRKG